jgi:hypothetical protein
MGTLYESDELPAGINLTMRFSRWHTEMISRFVGTAFPQVLPAHGAQESSDSNQPGIAPVPAVSSKDFATCEKRHASLWWEGLVYRKPGPAQCR